MTRTMLSIALGVLLFVGACGDESSPRNTPPAGAAELTLGGYPMSEFFIEHDRFISVTDPVIVSRAEAGFVSPDDEVFGVFEGGKARAYPITMMSYHHVVNDIVGGVPIAVTY